MHLSIAEMALLGSRGGFIAAALVAAVVSATPSFAQPVEPPRVENPEPVEPDQLIPEESAAPALEGEAGRDEQPAAAASASDRIDIDRLERSLLEGGAVQRELEPAPPVPGVRVVLRGLDKMTGALGEAEARVGETAKLWRLEVDVKACFSRPQASASAAGSAFVKIRDVKPSKSEEVFSGWMFAASPALSAMDHPRYDVWVLSCSTS